METSVVVGVTWTAESCRRRRGRKRREEKEGGGGIPTFWWRRVGGSGLPPRGCWGPHPLPARRAKTPKTEPRPWEYFSWKKAPSDP